MRSQLICKYVNVRSHERNIRCGILKQNVCHNYTSYIHSFYIALRTERGLYQLLKMDDAGGTQTYMSQSLYHSATDAMWFHKHCRSSLFSDHFAIEYCLIKKAQHAQGGIKLIVHLYCVLFRKMKKNPIKILTKLLCPKMSLS